MFGSLRPKVTSGPEGGGCLHAGMLFGRGSRQSYLTRASRPPVLGVPGVRCPTCSMPSGADPQSTAAPPGLRNLLALCPYTIRHPSSFCPCILTACGSSVKHNLSTVTFWWGSASFGGRASIPPPKCSRVVAESQCRLPRVLYQCFAPNNECVTGESLSAMDACA